MWTVYLMAKRPRGTIYVGYTKDIKRLYQEYQLPVWSWPSKSMIFHIEQDPQEHLVRQRFEELSRAIKDQLIALVESVNPNWIEYQIGINILQEVNK